MLVLVFCALIAIWIGIMKFLIAGIELNGYEITGNSIEKNIVDYDFSDSEEEYISEIQIPVKNQTK